MWFFFIFIQIIESKNLTPNGIRNGATIWCGTEGETYTSAGNYLWLQFVSDFRYSAIGFDIEYTIGRLAQQGCKCTDIERNIVLQSKFSRTCYSC